MAAPDPVPPPRGAATLGVLHREIGGITHLLPAFTGAALSTGPGAFTYFGPVQVAAGASSYQGAGTPARKTINEAWAVSRLFSPSPPGVVSKPRACQSCRRRERRVRRVSLE